MRNIHLSRCSLDKDHKGPCKHIPARDTTRPEPAEETATIFDILPPRPMRANDRAVHFIEHLSSADRKEFPMATGVLDYFPDALAMVARVSKLGNDKHNPGQPLHWAREKSTDQPDTILRHMSTRDQYEVVTLPDGRVVLITHKAMVAWRALAQLQEELETMFEAAQAAGVPFRPGLPPLEP